MSVTRYTEKSMTDKIKSYIGLAQRAGCVLYGEDIICEKKKQAKVVLVSSEASDKYKERILAKLSDRPVFVVDGLCQALHRDGVNAVAVSNDGLANAIISLLR